MSLALKINQIPLVLGAEVSHEALVAAGFRPPGLWQRLRRRLPRGQAVYELENCEFRGLDESLHIYPCTHRYLDWDRRWRTRATLFVKHGRLERLLLQITDAQTAAINFRDRFAATTTAAIGQPSRQDRWRTCWQGKGARIAATLHPCRSDADFDLAVVRDFSLSPDY